MALWSQKILEIISALLNLLRLAYAPICDQVLRMFHVHLRRMCILIFFVYNVLKMSIKSKFSIVSFRISFGFLVSCLEDLYIDVSVVLKSHTMIVFPLIYPFMSVNICHIYQVAPISGAYMLMILISSTFFLSFCLFWGCSHDIWQFPC